MGFLGSDSKTSVKDDHSQSNVTGGADSQNLHLSVGGSKNVVSLLDGGAIQKAFDAIDKADARAATSLTEVLNASRDILGMASANVKDAYSSAQADTKGGFDQRTIMMLAGLAVVGFVFWTRKGK